MKRMALVLLCFLLPVAASAQTSVTRADGFALLWQSIRRPAEQTREAPFTDVPKGHPQEPEITYAKARGLLDDDSDKFSPDVAMDKEDALLWLYRTRSVDDLDTLTVDNLSGLNERFPLVESGADLTAEISQEELVDFARTLDTQLATEDHEVSLYSEKFHGKGTAFGEAFNMYALTAAHRTFPHNTLVKVTNIANGQSVTVRINDRGPYVEGRDMDLSLAAFTSIADRAKGKIRATFERLGDTSLVGDCAQERRYQRRVTKDILLHPGLPHALPLGEDIALSGNKAFVIRGVRYPGGEKVKLQDFVFPGEDFKLKPSIEGEYAFLVGSPEGRLREMTVRVVDCSVHE